MGRAARTDWLLSVDQIARAPSHPRKKAAPEGRRRSSSGAEGVSYNTPLTPNGFWSIFGLRSA